MLRYMEELVDWMVEPMTKYSLRLRDPLRGRNWRRGGLAGRGGRLGLGRREFGRVLFVEEIGLWWERL
jgi:hypothetical protein